MISDLKKDKRQKLIALVAEKNYNKFKKEHLGSTVKTCLWADDYILSVSICDKFAISCLYMILPPNCRLKDYDYALWDYGRQNDSNFIRDIETLEGFNLLTVSLYEDLSDYKVDVSSSKLETELKKMAKHLNI